MTLGILDFGNFAEIIGLRSSHIQSIVKLKDLTGDNGNLRIGLTPGKRCVESVFSGFKLIIELIPFLTICWCTFPNSSLIN